MPTLENLVAQHRILTAYNNTALEEEKEAYRVYAQKKSAHVDVSAKLSVVIEQIVELYKAAKTEILVVKDEHELVVLHSTSTGMYASVRITRKVL